MNELTLPALLAVVGFCLMLSAVIWSFATRKYRPSTIWVILIGGLLMVSASIMQLNRERQSRLKPGIPASAASPSPAGNAR